MGNEGGPRWLKVQEWHMSEPQIGVSMMNWLRVELTSAELFCSTHVRIATAGACRRQFAVLMTDRKDSG
jgi:hypothetical protein